MNVLNYGQSSTYISAVEETGKFLRKLVNVDLKVQTVDFAEWVNRSDRMVRNWFTKGIPVEADEDIAKALQIPTDVFRAVVRGDSELPNEYRNPRRLFALRAGFPQTRSFVWDTPAAVAMFDLFRRAPASCQDETLEQLDSHTVEILMGAFELQYQRRDGREPDVQASPAARWITMLVDLPPEKRHGGAMELEYETLKGLGDFLLEVAKKKRPPRPPPPDASKIFTSTAPEPPKPTKGNAKTG